MARIEFPLPRDRRGRPHRIVRAAGVVTPMAAGALAMVVLAPHAVAESEPSNALQPVIDQLIDAQQQIEDTNSTYPFIVPSDLPMLHEYTQNLSTTMLATLLGSLSHTQFHNTAMTWVPYPWSAPAADPQEFLALPNPDNLYSPVQVDPNQTYVITVDPGPGSQDVTFTPNSGNGVTVDYQPLPGGIDLAHATPNPDGSYTITLSSTAQPGNWVDIAGAQRVLIRDTVGDWGQLHDSFSIQQEGATATTTLPLLSDDQISSLLSGVAADMPTVNASGSYYGQQQVPDTIPANTFSPIQDRLGSTLPGPALSSQIGSIGHFSLEPDQALIVKVPDIEAGYSGVQLANDWGQTAPYATVSGSLNDTQAFHDPDGFTYYVISSQDPGVANWVDDSGLADGNIVLRWQQVTGTIPTTPIQAEVVNVADVRDDLPADTPLVTAAERAADLKERLFEYDYVHDQTHNTAWLGANLEYDQVKAAIGDGQFNAIFGGQSDVPSVADRLTPALSPDLATVVHDILTNPAGSLSAITDNASLLVNDIKMPALLAAARLVELVEQTAQAVQTDISSGDLSQALTALGAGVHGLATVFNETWTDPATSITAGILNARDDLAVAVMNADIASVGADLVPNAGGFSWDLLP